MSDRFYASMEIGGKLKRSDVPEFIAALNEAGASDCNENEITASSEEELVELLADGWPPVLRIHDCEAGYGKMYSIPEVCKKLGLSFNHRNDAAYEYDGETEYVRDGKDIGWQYSTQSGDPTITVKELQEEFGTQLAGMEKCTPTELRNAMLRLTRLDIPALPAFEIVD